jgi:hypothetical protein
MRAIAFIAERATDTSVKIKIAPKRRLFQKHGKNQGEEKQARGYQVIQLPWEANASAIELTVPAILLLDGT